MRSFWFAVAVMLAPVGAAAIPVSFSDEFGAATPSTDFTAPNTPFAFSFDAPATLGQISVLGPVQYTFDGHTGVQTAIVSAVGNGDGTDTLNVLIIEKYLGVDFLLTAPVFLSGATLVAGSYQPTSENGAANIASMPSVVSFSIVRPSPLNIGAVGSVPEPATWCYSGLALDLAASPCAAVDRAFCADQLADVQYFIFS